MDTKGPHSLTVDEEWEPEGVRESKPYNKWAHNNSAMSLKQVSNNKEITPGPSRPQQEAGEVYEPSLNCHKAYTAGTRGNVIAVAWIF